MAFVFQAERTGIATNNSVSQDIGPGSYITHEYYKVKQGNAPFDSLVSRNERIQNENIPGPGSYYQDDQYDYNNYGVQPSPNLMKLKDKKLQSSIFASQSRRFDQPNTTMTPGPGSYETNKVEIKPIQQQYTSQSYMEILQSLNRYQSIPSIPTDNQVYGYTEKGEHDLESNKNPQPTYSGIKLDTVGPGKYQIKDTFEYNKNKGTCWHKSKSPRLAPSLQDKNLSLGPGSYDSNRSITPLYKLNPSGNFQSKSTRTFDNSKGDKQKQLMKNYFDKQKEKLLRNPGFQDLEDEEYQFCDETTPGPGHYFGNTSTLSQSSSNSLQSIKFGKDCFGSKSKRFQEQKINYLIGPGEYQLKTKNIKQNIIQPPFLSSNSRFESKLLDLMPGPQSYDPKISLKEKLIKKLEHTPIGNFGINETRFKQEYDQIPGPGTYDQNDKQIKGINSIFKSKTERGINHKQISNNNPAPGFYNVKNNTIEYDLKKNEEENQEIQSKAFGSSMPRFERKKKEIFQDQQKIDEDQDEELGKLHNTSALFKKTKNSQVAFNVRENRFQKIMNDTQKLGPGEYFSLKSGNWDKKSFNVIFQKM
ncbi:unnamed protein product [Paramecium sonneborni]|uniref:Sperm-tail PG-rich repeat protein n=1 Tax=Paramecium sonneborni TaxID=65129 RepID=A0A8S1QLY2_9CILI|nr:unnamed protein product [Paramecium sonneborni]